MANTVEERVSALYRAVLYISVLGMISGKLMHALGSQLGSYLVRGGVSLLVLCPLMGLLTVAVGSLRSNRKRLFTSSLLVTVLILLSMAAILIAGGH